MPPAQPPSAPAGPLQALTVGPTGADVCGATGRALQVAIDALAYRGGGTVQVQPGEYLLDGPVRLRSGVTLRGVEGKTVLKRAPAIWSRLAVDADIGQRQITPVGAAAFRPGMGVVLRDDEQPFPQASMPLTITRIEGGDLHLDDYVTLDFLAERGGLVATYYPMVHAFEQCDLAVEGLILDSGLDEVGPLEGIWGRGLYLRRCHRAAVRAVESMGCLGDGFGCGQGSHVTFEDCRAHHNTHYGIHPGSHSPHTRIARCQVHDNGADGVYLCWGVRHSEVVDCDVHDNGARLYRNGICTGHKDTDNLIAGNRVRGNAKHGIHFREKTAANGAHRTTVRDNLIEDNGWPFERVPASLKHLPRQELLGHGIYVSGVTHDLRFAGNTIRETRAGDQRHQRHGLYLARGVTRTTVAGNHIAGHPDAAIVDAAGDSSNQIQAV
ncbi:MAG: right-handed parallel beta-helix repeat-containing protein [Gemmatimonadota bacterium]